MSNIFLHLSPFAREGGELIGRDPRVFPTEEWTGHPLLVGLRAVRSKCMDCTSTANGVRKCVQSDCPLWPLRMGSVPRGFRVARERAVLGQVAPEGILVPEDADLEQEPAHRAENDAEALE